MVSFLKWRSAADPLDVLKLMDVKKVTRLMVEQHTDTPGYL